MVLADPITTFTDEELVRMEERAYWEAVRCYREARGPIEAEPGDVGEIRRILLESADSANEHWGHIKAEVDRRDLRVRRWSQSVLGV